MTDDIEDKFVAECRRQGYQPGPDVMRQVAVDLAGSVLTDAGLISLPGRGSISMTDLARSLRGQMPEDFGSLADDKPEPTGHTGLTAAYVAELSANRNRRVDASKYSGITRQFIEENNQGKIR